MCIGFVRCFTTSVTYICISISDSEVYLIYACSFIFLIVDIVSMRCGIKVYGYEQKKIFPCFSYIINSIKVCLRKEIRCYI